jgi:hypothetical protein
LEWHPSARWIEFKADTDSFGLLKWDFEDDLSTSVNFLDLTVSIGSSGEILTKTYQMKINLYQYPPPHSAQNPNVAKGVVYSLLRQYKRQDSLPSDFIKQAKLLFQRLVARGWDRKQNLAPFNRTTNALGRSKGPLYHSSLVPFGLYCTQLVLADEAKSEIIGHCSPIQVQVN